MPGSALFQTIISTDELNQHLNQDNWVIVDCRFDLSDANAGFGEYKTTHIPGAVYAQLDHDLSSTPTETSGRHPLPDWVEFQSTLGIWGIDSQTQVIVYDHSHGGFAGRLWWMLRALGHDAVALLDGGWTKWARDGFEVEDRVVTNSQKTFKGQLQADWIVPVERIEQNLQQPELMLIDSREGARYRGESEPIDTEAGHIPGALNHFFGNNLNEHGEFLPADKLKQQFETLIDHRPLDEVVVYCGSGVSEHAGLSGAKLYVGSWSEWSRNPDHPFNTGDQP
jgi:thiosulfate/3-mercaptopyruvate sulfurtransferase